MRRRWELSGGYDGPHPDAPDPRVDYRREPDPPPGDTYDAATEHGPLTVWDEEHDDDNHEPTGLGDLMWQWAAQ